MKAIDHCIDYNYLGNNYRSAGHRQLSRSDLKAGFCPILDVQSIFFEHTYCKPLEQRNEYFFRK